MVATLVLVAAMSRASHAQGQETPDTTTTLPPVVVTVTRATGALLMTPLAVTTVGVADMRAVRGVGLDEALSLVPGVLAQSRYGSSDVRLVIRGFGARGAGDRSNAGTSRGVRVLVDGIPETEPDGRTSFDQIDLAASEGVEVVRSNASAVWGNAAGGVVNVLTIPSAMAPRLEATAMSGSFGLRRYTSRAVSAFGDGGVGFVNFTNTSFDGWRAHSSARRALVNAGAVGTLGTGTRVGAYLSAANNLFHVPGPLTRAQLDADPRQANATYASRDERRHNRVARLAATVDHAISATSSVSAMLFVNPKLLQRSERGTYRDFTRYHLGGHLVGRTEHGRDGAVRGRVTAGVDEAYQDGAILFYSLTPDGTRGTTLRDNKREGANNFGAFVQDELCAAADRACLTIGARYDAVNYHYQSYITPSLNDTKSFTRVTPKVGVSWLLDARHSVYANVGGGIEVPAGNETDPAGTFGLDTLYAINPLLDAIRSTTYEVGAKSVAVPDGAALVRWAYDIALYTTDVRNEIVPYQGGRFYFTAGRARRSGAELGLTASVRDGPFARGALTLSRNRYATYVVDSTYYGKPAARADYSGNEIVGVPSVFATAEVGSAIPGLPALRVKGSAEHTGGYYVDDANTTSVAPFTTYNATLEFGEWSAVRGLGLGLRGFISVQNVFDTRYVGSAFLNPDRVAGVPVAYEPGMPRSVVLSLSAGWRR